MIYERALGFDGVVARVGVHTLIQILATFEGLSMLKRNSAAWAHFHVMPEHRVRGNLMAVKLVQLYQILPLGVASVLS